ncbi:MAG: hypothetical protein R2698_12820 [Microthrixaceae bacterium]
MTDPVSCLDPVAISRPEHLVAAIAEWLAAVHSTRDHPQLPVFGVDDALSDAAALVAGDLVDPSLFEGPSNGQPATRILEVARVLRTRLDDEPVVPIRGSIRLEDLAVRDGHIVGPSDEGVGPRALGDRYQDLADAAAALAAHIGPGAVPALFDRYGESPADPIRLEVWSLLYQLRVRGRRSTG